MFFLIDRLITYESTLVEFSISRMKSRARMSWNIFMFSTVKVTDAVSSEKNFIFFLGNNS